MASETEPRRWSNRIGRSLQPESRAIYREHTDVMDRGLHLDRERSQWQEPKPERWLAEEVQQAVRRRLPLRPDPRSYRDYDALAADFTASVEFLRAATVDLRQFIDGLVEVNNRYSSNVAENAALRKTFWESYYGDIAKQALSSLMPPAVILSAELEGMLVEVAAMELRDRLDRMAERFSKGVAGAFAELQAAELIGRVDWKVPTACDSFYYEDTVLHEHLGEEVVEVSSPKDVEFNYQQLFKRVQQEVKKVSKDRHVVRHGLHFKVVGNAEKSTVDNFPMVIPQHVQSFLKTSPDWLRDLMQIVRGKTRTDIVVARDIFVEEREVTKTHVHEWKEPCFCPLVTVGDYVLTGWGTREATVETARQNYGWLYLLSVALVGMAAISIGLARLGSPLWGYAAPLAATLSLGTFIEACRERAIARGEMADIWGLLTAGFAWFTFSSGLMGLMVGVAGGSWIIGTASALVCGLGADLLRRVVRRRKQDQ